METRESSAVSNNASAAARARKISASSSAASKTSTTPRTDRSPSRVAGVIISGSGISATAAMSLRSKSWLTRISGVVLSRCAVKAAWMVPRWSFCASLARASGSTASKGGERRNRASRPLALTALSSQVKAPWPGASGGPGKSRHAGECHLKMGNLNGSSKPHHRGCVAAAQAACNWYGFSISISALRQERALRRHRGKFLNRAGKPSSPPISPTCGKALWTRGSAPEMDY